MSIERQITRELDGILACIRKAEANIIGLDSADKLDVVGKLVNIEDSIKAIKGEITIPVLEISKDTLLDDIRSEEILSVRAYTVLKRAGCNTISDITAHTSDEIGKFRNMGTKAHKEVLEFMKNNGFELKKEE